MEFNSTVEQKMIKESARKFFGKELTKAKIQELQEKKIEIEENFWQKIAKLGWLGLVFPQEYEGGEFGLMDLAALYEECGRALMPTVFYSTMAAAFCIQNGGNAEQKKNLLTWQKKLWQRILFSFMHQQLTT